MNETITESLPLFATDTTSWVPMNLSEILAHAADIPEPSILPRSDGVCMLYAGKTHAFVGESESCKTWAALIAAKSAMESGQLVLWVDYEDDAVTAVSRLTSLMVAKDVIAACFHYVNPKQQMEAHGRFTSAHSEFQSLLTTDYGLVVIDGVTESMENEGMDLNSNSEVAQWSHRIPLPLSTTGAAVVMIDHVVKSTEGNKRYAIGGQHKLSGLTGVQYVFSVLSPFYRARYVNVEGKIALTVAKDRPGHVRSNSKDGSQFGTLELTSYPDGGVTFAIVAAQEAQPDKRLASAILTYLSTYDGSSKKQIEDGVTGNAQAKRNTLLQLTTDGYIEVKTHGASHKHYLTQKGKQ